MEEELELRVIVKANNVGTKVRALVEDPEFGPPELVSAGYAIEIKSIARADGLPFTIDEDFADFLKDNAAIFGGRLTETDIARKAYYEGRKTK